MTCKEKLMMEHPNIYEHAIHNDCPSDHGLANDPEPDWCNNDACSACWAREATGMNKPVFEYRNPKVIAKVVDVKEENGGLTVTTEPIIKDSGDRTEFATGAVRDMREGKGRCDLMPLEVVGELMGDSIIPRLKTFLKFKNTQYLYTILNDFSKFYDDGKVKGTPDKICEQRYCTMFLEVAKHFEEGAKKYGESNWQKGIPVHCYIDSAIRHYLKWLRGDKDELHDRAFVWNLMCCIWEVDYHKEE